VDAPLQLYVSRETGIDDIIERELDERGPDEPADHLFE